MRGRGITIKKTRVATFAQHWKIKIPTPATPAHDPTPTPPHNLASFLSLSSSSFPGYPRDTTPHAHTRPLWRKNARRLPPSAYPAAHVVPPTLKLKKAIRHFPPRTRTPRYPLSCDFRSTWPHFHGETFWTLVETGRC